jgi:hypothetical protein
MMKNKTAAAFVAQNSWTRRKAALEDTVKSLYSDDHRSPTAHRKHQQRLEDDNKLAASD